MDPAAQPTPVRWVQRSRTQHEEIPGRSCPPSRPGSPHSRDPFRPLPVPSPQPQPQPQPQPSSQKQQYGPLAPSGRRKSGLPKNQHAQKTVDQFWAKFSSATPGKAFNILPDNFFAKRIAAVHQQEQEQQQQQQQQQRGHGRNGPDSSAPGGGGGSGSASDGKLPIPGKNALASYAEAHAACKSKVEKIVRECRRVNQKYRDPHFDIEADFRRWGTERPYSDCLMGLYEIRNDLRPASVKRVEDIFEMPQFFIEGATASDVRQGKEGDCWFMSALCTLSNKEELIQRVCVARDEQVGVYGFVFHRDGEWISEVIDDKLYLIKEDFNDATLERNRWLELQNRARPEEEYRNVMQTGSRALYFAQCSDPNETWLPLLEKAYAKAHGDYSALESGFVGEGIEDLTGGVTTELFSTDILDKDKFWREELLNVNEQFLFGCGQMHGAYGSRTGIIEKHAYSVMEAREVNGERLLKLRNPWGNTEWSGAWSDGSAEWTPEWMNLLDHKFGDDGVFWISYKDLLRNYQHFDRTRLFGPEWTVTQQWTSINVPWSVDYLDTKFKISLSESGPVVIVLSQLDDRYFRGLEGQYEFHLQFRLHKDDEDDYIVRSNAAYYMKRSISTELDLEAGVYSVLLKITAKRFPNDPTVEEVIAGTCQFRREKLLSIGLSYDLAHAKGQFRELEVEKFEKERKQRRERRKNTAKKMHEARILEHKRQKLRTIRQEIKREEKAMKKMARQAQEQAAMETREDAPSVPRRLEELKLEDDGGLGILGGSQIQEPFSYGSKAERRPSDGSLKAFHADQNHPTSPPRPTTSNAAGNGRSKSGSISVSRPPSPFTGNIPRRRETLTIQPANGIHISSGGFGAPDIRLRRASKDENKLSLGDISDDDLSWDSEIDAPIDSDDDNIRQSGLGPATMASCSRYGAADQYGFDAMERSGSMISGDVPRAGRPNNGGRGGQKEGDQDEWLADEFGRDPWNAVCVIGLRVYSRDSDVSIEVVKGEKDSADIFSPVSGQKSLDVDDANKDAVREPVTPTSPEARRDFRNFT